MKGDRKEDEGGEKGTMISVGGEGEGRKLQFGKNRME